mgnify:FL=1|jgi:hypothetical protein
MNRSSMQKQMMGAGGKLNMVKGKDGKMVPDYAADGKGKMKAGGMAEAYKKPVKKMMEGGMAKMPKYSAGDMVKGKTSKVRGHGIARGGKACKMR